MSPWEFLSTLFAHCPGDIAVDLRCRRGPARSVGLGQEFDVSPKDDVYYSVGYSVGNERHCPAVWCDIDGPLSSSILPKPTFVVDSGRGTHLYWRLSTPIVESQVLRTVGLMALAYGGDYRVVTANRAMRLPGSFNQKIKPPALCALISSEDIDYTIMELEAAALARLLGWSESGNRHSLALGLAALLIRCGRSKEAIIAMTQYVCEFANDDESDDRLRAITDTINVASANGRISYESLMDVLGADFRKIAMLLGLASRDGDLLLAGDVIGRLETLEVSLADYLADRLDWAFAENTMMVWKSTHWEPVIRDNALLDNVFDAIRRLTVIKSGVEVPYGVTVNLARGLKDVLAGHFEQSPLAALDEHLVPVQNGVLDTMQGNLLPHDKTRGARWVLPVVYDPAAICPGWMQFLTEAAPSTYTYLQEWVGYLFVRGNPYQQMLWLYGPSGTGKSTFLQTIDSMLGPAAIAIPAGQLKDYQIAALASAKVAMCLEISTRQLRTAQLKALVCDDPVDARHLYGKPFKLRFDGKFFWASNDLPPVDQSEGMWRRPKIVPFIHVPSKVDPLIISKLRAELPGILNWSLAGLARVRRYLKEDVEWTVPAEVIAIVQEYRAAADIGQAWFDDALEFKAGGITPYSELYFSHREWAKEHGYDPLPDGVTFRELLKRLGAMNMGRISLGGKQVRCWQNLQVTRSVF